MTTTIDNLLTELRAERERLESKLGQLETAIGQAEQLANTLAGRITTQPAVKREKRTGQGKTSKAYVAATSRQTNGKPKFKKHASDRDDVLAAITKLAPVSRTDLKAATPHLSPGRLTRALQSLKDQTKVKTIGQTSGTRYVLFGDDSGEAPDEPRTPLQQRILKVLDLRPMAATEIAGQLVARPMAVDAALGSLEAAGAVTREGDVWSLAS